MEAFKLIVIVVACSLAFKIYNKTGDKHMKEQIIWEIVCVRVVIR